MSLNFNKDILPINYIGSKNQKAIEAIQRIQRINAINLNEIENIQTLKQKVLESVGQQKIANLILQNLKRENGKYKWRFNLQGVLYPFKIESPQVFKISQIMKQLIQNIKVQFKQFLDKIANICRFTYLQMNQDKIIQQNKYKLHIEQDQLGSFKNVFRNMDLDEDIAWLENCGHWLHAEKPQQFSQILSSFIQKCENRV